MTDDSKPDWEEWFRDWGPLKVETISWVGEAFRIEELYQMFKARMMAEMGIGERQEREEIDRPWFPGKLTAPWPDYNGNPIREGDTIRHPSGDTGVVELWRQCSDPGSQWRVRYADHDNQVSRLCLQIGEKGMAVVVQEKT